MASLYKNDKNFLIIEMSPLEATNCCGFGLKVNRAKNNLFCDNCNCRTINYDKVYYFAALNRLMCQDCVDDIIECLDTVAVHDDYEIRHYNYYAEKLNLKGYD